MTSQNSWWCSRRIATHITLERKWLFCLAALLKANLHTKIMRVKDLTRTRTITYSRFQLIDWAVTSTGMQDHWNAYISLKNGDDFWFMLANGLNAVRVPLGGWYRSRPNITKAVCWDILGSITVCLDELILSWKQFIIKKLR